LCVDVRVSIVGFVLGDCVWRRVDCVWHCGACNGVSIDCVGGADQLHIASGADLLGVEPSLHIAVLIDWVWSLRWWSRSMIDCMWS
jgi:hypothetical protein